MQYFNAHVFEKINEFTSDLSQQIDLDYWYGDEVIGWEYGAPSDEENVLAENYRKWYEEKYWKMKKVER